MDRRRNELRNAAGLTLKWRIIVAVQDLKISFYQKILVPPYFWLVPPHNVCSGDGIAPSPTCTPKTGYFHDKAEISKQINLQVHFRLLLKIWQEAMYFASTI